MTDATTLYKTALQVQQMQKECAENGTPYVLDKILAAATEAANRGFVWLNIIIDDNKFGLNFYNQAVIRKELKKLKFEIGKPIGMENYQGFLLKWYNAKGK